MVARRRSTLREMGATLCSGSRCAKGLLPTCNTRDVHSSTHAEHAPTAPHAEVTRAGRNRLGAGWVADACLCGSQTRV